MTLDEARTHIGNAVVYRCHHGDRERGVVTSVNERFVFVRYGSDAGSKATAPEMLDLLRPEVRPPLHEYERRARRDK